MVGKVRLQNEDVRRGEFDRLVQEHQHQIFRYCVLRLGAEYGEEVAQEVFLAAWQGWAHFRGDAQPATWLLGIAKHKCAQVFRNHSRREEIARRFGEEIRQRLHPDASAVHTEHTQGQEQLTRVAQGLQALKGEERLVLTLRYTKGVAVEEIAELIGKSEAAVRKQLLRTLQRLRRILEDVAEEHGARAVRNRGREP